MNTNETIHLFVDGSTRFDCAFLMSGWGYVTTQDEKTITSYGCGACDDGEDSEILAAIEGIVSLPAGSRIHLVTDTGIIYAALTGALKLKRNKSWYPLIKRLINVARAYQITCEVIQSGSRLMHIYADTMAREGCGLPPKKIGAGRRRRLSRKDLRIWDRTKRLSDRRRAVLPTR